jgi:energy-coupling factor transporter transmembrane protein EcfT
MFYRGVTLLLLISFLMLIVFIILKVFKKFTFISYREIVLNIICCFCLNLLFFTHLPITADRSISVFMLSYMNKNASRSLREEEITNIFIQKYVKENLSTAKRLNEQLEGGTIVKDGNGYKINDRGRLVIQFYNFVADIFHIDKKLISP